MEVVDVDIVETNPGTFPVPHRRINRAIPVCGLPQDQSAVVLEGVGLRRGPYQDRRLCKSLPGAAASSLLVSEFHSQRV